MNIMNDIKTQSLKIVKELKRSNIKPEHKISWKYFNSNTTTSIINLKEEVEELKTEVAIIRQTNFGDGFYFNKYE